MKFRSPGAAALIAIPLVFLAGCAAEQPQAQQTADARNPCIGVAPATGTMVRRKEDCGASSAGRDAATQEMIDQIRNAQGMGRSVVSPVGR